MQQYNDITSVIIKIAGEIGHENGIHKLSAANADTILYGTGGSLDSLMLVRLLAETEEEIFNVFGKEITIADERAMSQKHSPFRSVGSLAEYIEKLLSESDE